MQRLFAALLLAGLVTATASADDKKGEPEKKAEPSKLKVGDPPPALHASKWLQGKEVAAFEPGKVYVVEFWATWCGPCIVMMPHLSELASEFKDKGLTVIGYTAKDPNNSADKVAQFVAKRGPKLGYTFAFADNRDTNKAWLEAAGQTAIPCSFVIDQKGKIAYIGHPMLLGEVLPKVVAGTWNAGESAKDLKQAEDDVDVVFEKLNDKDPQVILKAIADLQAKRPALGNLPYFVAPKLAALLKANKVDEAKLAIAAVLDKAIEHGDPAMLRTVANVVHHPTVKKEKWAREMFLRTADAFLKDAGDRDLDALVMAAAAYHEVGQQERAKEFGKKALEAGKGLSNDDRAELEAFVKKISEAAKE